MSGRMLTRRRVLGMMGASTVVATALPIGRALAQTPMASPGIPGGITLPVFGHTVAATDPWSIDPNQGLQGKVNVVNQDSRQTVDTVDYDKVTAVGPDESRCDLLVLPAVDAGNTWDIVLPWPPADAHSTIVEEGDIDDNSSYRLSTVTIGNRTWGYFQTLDVLNTSTEHLSANVALPRETFADAMNLFLASVTIDGRPVFADIDPAVLQERLG